jgi:hydrogenase nickel incorporation protein HypA/HybF
MHELGIAQQMLNVALEYAQQHNATRITQFSVEMSAAADESEDSLRFHLENVARGTIAEGAVLEIIRVPARVECLDCGQDFAWESDDLICPNCGSARVQPILRDEFRLASIDVE